MTQVADKTPPAVPPPSRPALQRRRLPRVQELGLLIVIAVLYVFLGVEGYVHAVGGYSNKFLNFDNQINGIATYTSIYAIMAVGMTCVIITGGIDISVGAVFGLSALIGARVLQDFDPGAPWYLVLPVAFAVPTLIGGLCGLANGLLVVGLRMHPFIVTLATMGIFQTIAVRITPHGAWPAPGRQLPMAFTKGFMKAEINLPAWLGGGPDVDALRFMPMLIMLAVVIVGGVYMHLTVWGRETYAVGGNTEAARFSGIRVWWVTLRVYVIMGLCAGLAGVVQLGRFSSASTANGLGDELLVIAAAVVGGASLSGGRGTALGAMLGALVIRLIDNGIMIMDWNRVNTKAIVGAAIIIAVAIDQLSEYLSQRRLSGARQRG